MMHPLQNEMIMLLLRAPILPQFVQISSALLLNQTNDELLLTCYSRLNNRSSLRICRKIECLSKLLVVMSLTYVVDGQPYNNDKKCQNAKIKHCVKLYILRMPFPLQ